MSYTVEKIGEYEDLTAVVIMTDMGHRCGYVGIPSYHPLYGKSYNKGTKVLTRMLKRIKRSPIGKRGIISLFCWDGKKASPEIVFNVHGGLTYSGGCSKDYPIKKKGTWWFGYDCAHAGDGKDLSVVSDTIREIHEKFPHEDPIRSLEYCINECENLAKQLKAVTERR